MSEVEGLLVSVYRSGGSDCTNGGISGKVNGGLITGDGVDCKVFTPSEENPHYVIIKDNVCGRERIRAVPADLLESGKWTMFGGNFLYTSDSRFPSNAPIAIHDRVES